MANITKVIMKNVQVYNPTTDVWTDVSGINGTPVTVCFGTAANSEGIQLYSNTTGLPLTAQLSAPINFNSVTAYPSGTTGLDMFGTGAGQINTTTTKSPFIRYTLTTINTDGTITEGYQYYHLMMSADLSADPYIDAESTTTLTGNINQLFYVTFWFPAITSQDNPGVPADLVSEQQALLSDASRWHIWIYDDSTGINAEYLPVHSVDVITLTAEDAADYGMAKIKVKLGIYWAFPVSDTFHCLPYFTSNDQEGDVAISSAEHDIAVTVTPYIMEPFQTAIISWDSDIGTLMTYDDDLNAYTITSVWLVDVEWWDHSGMTWKSVHGQSISADPESNIDFGPGGKGMVIGEGTAGVWSINFAAFTDEDATNTDYTIFGANTGQIPVATKSPLLRYKTKTTNSEPSSATSTSYFYAMLKARTAADNRIAEASTATVNEPQKNINLALYVPGVTTTEPNGQGEWAIEAQMHDTYVERTRWTVRIKDPEGMQHIYYPSTVTVDAPNTTATDIASYGLAKFPVTLNLDANFPNTGTYTADATFQSNDMELLPSVVVPTVWEIVATIPGYYATPEYGNIVSLDDDAVIKINFSQDT